jgi:hypothetical protein
MSDVEFGSRLRKEPGRDVFGTEVIETIGKKTPPNPAVI